MKKSSKSGAQRKKKSSPKSAAPKNESRRSALFSIRNMAIGAVALGGAGYFGTTSLMASMCEMDLTVVGEGTPTIVQVHDPQCPRCQQLQKQTRKALKSFDHDDFLYRVANVRTIEGGTFAGRFAVPHVTLLLFDENGQLQATLRGVKQADELVEEFRSNLKLRPKS